MKEEKEKRIDTKKEKEIKTGDVTMHETEEPADVFPEKTGDNLIFLDDPKLRKDWTRPSWAHCTTRPPSALPRP